MKRIVSYDTVLGIHDKCFKLKKGDEIETFEPNKYGRTRILIQSQFALISTSMLDRIFNKKL